MECYSEWAGPCKAITSTLKTLYFSYSDRPIKFYTVGACQTAPAQCRQWAACLLPHLLLVLLLQVNADKVKDKALDQYRSKCQPAFLLFKVSKRPMPTNP